MNAEQLLAKAFDAARMSEELVRGSKPILGMRWTYVAQAYAACGQLAKEIQSQTPVDVSKTTRNLSESLASIPTIKGIDRTTSSEGRVIVALMDRLGLSHVSIPASDWNDLEDNTLTIYEDDRGNRVIVVD